MPKPKLPKVIYVGAADYRVRGSKNFDLLGETHNDDTEIVIRTQKQSAACMRDTLLHEVMHAICWSSGFGHTIDNNDEERLIRVLTPWILGVLRDNPDLVDFLLEDADG